MAACTAVSMYAPLHAPMGRRAIGALAAHIRITSVDYYEWDIYNIHTNIQLKIVHGGYYNSGSEQPVIYFTTFFKNSYFVIYFSTSKDFCENPYFVIYFTINKIFLRESVLRHLL